MAVLFAALRPLENHPLPGWDGPPAITSVCRDAAAGMLLCTAGAATLASVKWGLKDDGLVCVAVPVTALAVARVPAQPSDHNTHAVGGIRTSGKHATRLQTDLSLTLD